MDKPENLEDGGENAKTFTQEQLDEILKERLGRQKKAVTNDLFSSLGVESADDIQAQLKELATLRESQMSEAEKQAKEAQDLRAQLEAANSQAKEAMATVQRQKTETAVLLAANKLNFQDANDVLRMVDINELAKDGTDIEKALKDLAESKPYLLKQNPTIQGSFIRKPQPKNQPENNGQKFRSIVRF